LPPQTFMLLLNNTKGKRTFRYRLSPETSGYTLELTMKSFQFIRM